MKYLNLLVLALVLTGCIGKSKSNSGGSGAPAVTNYSGVVAATPAKMRVRLRVLAKVTNTSIKFLMGGEARESRNGNTCSIKVNQGEIMQLSHNDVDQMQVTYQGQSLSYDLVGNDEWEAVLQFPEARLTKTVRIEIDGPFLKLESICDYY